MLKSLYAILTCVIPWTYSAITLPIIWQDEFDGTALDTSKWNIITGNLGVNKEHQYYQGDNLEVSGGYLLITARKETAKGQNYTSGRIDSLHKFSTKYGRIEARIKLPMVTGSWPAFWMLGDSYSTVGWPKCGELDIMEHVNAGNTIMGTLHWYSNGQADYGTTTDINTPGDWHIYATEWDSQSIKIFVDDTQYFVMDITGSGEVAFQNPFFIILNLAIGGTLPGHTIDDTAFPVKYLIDYVRVCGNLTNTTMQPITPFETTLTVSDTSENENSMAE